MSPLAAKIPVEPLAPHRVARVEHSVLAAYGGVARGGLGGTGRGAPRWRQVYWLAPAAVAAAALLFWFGLRTDEGDAPHAPVVAAGYVLPAVIQTAPGGATHVDLGDAKIDVAGDSTVRIGRSGIGDGGESGIEVVLERGRVECNVDPRGARPPFVVRAGAVDVTVVGTIFSVERGATKLDNGSDDGSDDDWVTVQVTRGKVRVESISDTKNQVTSMVAAGERWNSHTGSSGAQTATAARNPDLDSIDVNEGKSATSGTDARVARTDAAKRSHESRGSGNTGKAPATTKHRRKSRRDSARNAKLRRAKSFAGGLVPAPTLSAILPLSIAELDNVIATDASQRRHALYSKAYIQLLRARRARDARGTIDYFERRFNRGAYAEDVLQLRIMMSCSRASSACRAAAHTYLRRYPNGSYRDSARALTNWM